MIITSKKRIIIKAANSRHTILVDESPRCSCQCKINPDRFDPKSLIAFRSLYPNGDNYIISPDIKMNFKRNYEALTLNYSSLANCPIFAK
jgi:hypothetical protein